MGHPKTVTIKPDKKNKRAAQKRRTAKNKVSKLTRHLRKFPADKNRPAVEKIIDFFKSVF
jgi:hypothetical protein